MIDIDKYHKAKITEGPWKYKREADTEDGDYRIYIVAPPYGAQGRIAKMLGEHTYADAQLMADAPLLLDLLIDARRMVKQLHAMLDEDDGFNWAINNIGEQEMIWWNQEATE
jgi:hypothetical protein